MEQTFTGWYFFALMVGIFKREASFLPLSNRGPVIKEPVEVFKFVCENTADVGNCRHFLMVQSNAFKNLTYVNKLCMKGPNINFTKCSGHSVLIVHHLIDS